MMPVKSPTAPTPSEAAKPSDSEADAEGKVGSSKPNSRIGVPARPRNDRRTVNQPRIIGWDVNDVGFGGFNYDVRVFLLYLLLRRVFEIAGLLGAPTHHLHSVHYVLLLVVVGVAEGRRPGKILVHIPDDRGKRGQGFNAGIPRLRVDFLA